ncbi:hypothetical protein Cgig2_008732 [Carnegiea gigantea]|uniref:Myb/SANT-like DNA-binding domain-containing protein n=1 Tax=Carnegiea gigantea TaxID=171969 RepID=A0A9Q1KEN1_9CARY|nr:hypothetical protein Cgig2_008732 [Carnegiea gigantea]
MRMQQHLKKAPLGLIEGDLLLGNMMPGGPTYGDLDLQGSIRVNHHQDPHNSLQQQHHSQAPPGLMPHPSMHDNFSLSMGQSYKCVQPNLMADYNKSDRGKNSPSEEDEQSFNEEEVDGQDDLNKGIKASIWQRVTWTDSMVRLLITAVSYIGEDATSGCGPGGRRRYLNLQKKGKWKSVSKVMVERGFFVSPQQCEDKFNDLNKRYKKLNDILGRGTSCQVVEKPALLDMIEHLSEKMKDEVRKILSSKHLFYEEMCSYHNGNRLHLPHDPALRCSLQLALKSRDKHDTESRRHLHDNGDEDDHDAETDDHEEYEENHSWSKYEVFGDSTKRMKQGPSFEDFSFGNPQSTQDFNKGFRMQSQNSHPDMHLAFLECQKVPWLQKQWLRTRALQLEEQKLKIELEMVELEKQQMKWHRFNKKKDRELEKLKMENDRMKLENEHMELELKRMEMTLNYNQ